MNYHRDKNSPSLRAYLLVGVIIALGFLFVWGITLPQHAVNTIVAVASPLWQARGAAVQNAETLKALFASKEKLAKENEALRFALREARLELLGTSALRREYNALLGITTADDALIARVVARPPATVYDTFLVNRGIQDGVTDGALVFAGGAVVLGEVRDVYATNAQVQLYSTAGVKTDVLLGSEQIPTIAEGQGNGNFVAHVPREVLVTEGSTVLLATGGSETVLGIVGSVTEEADNTIKTVRFRSPVNTATLLFVSILEG